MGATGCLQPVFRVSGSIRCNLEADAISRVIEIDNGGVALAYWIAGVKMGATGCLQPVPKVSGRTARRFEYEPWAG